jgi:oligosaccharyltransferase complex subunit gamma
MRPYNHFAAARSREAFLPPLQAAVPPPPPPPSISLLLYIQVAELLALQAKARDSVVRLDVKSWEKYAGGKARPYSLIVYLNSKAVQSGQLAALLRDMRVEFGYTAASYAKSLKDSEREGKVFFAELDYNEESRDIFHRLGVSSLPYAFHLPGSVVARGDAKLKLDKDDRMTSKSNALPWDASTFQHFTGERVGILVDVVRPSIFRTWWWPLVAVAILLIAGYTGISFATSDFFKKNIERIGILASMFIYWFATSGGLYNIIRGMPFSYPDHQTRKMVYFLSGSGQQLGAEGFLNGTLYMMFAMPLTCMTFVIPRCG